MELLPDVSAIAPHAPVEPRFLRGIARVALARLAETHPDLAPVADVEVWLDRACAALARNITSGRIELAGQYQPGGTTTLLSYAGQVSVALLSEWDRVERLRTGDSASWAAVIERMERLGYYWLGPTGREQWAAWEAREIAAKTCADLWEWLQSNPFPFDVSFDRWSARALNNRLHEAARKRRSRSRYVVESLDRPVFDEGPTVGDLLQVETLDAWLEQAANREALHQALAGLDERQARVLRLWYLEGWPADEIAAELGQRINYVYVLRFRAIEKLRKIVATNERLGLTEVLRFLKDEEGRSLLVAGAGEGETGEALT